MPSEAHYGCQYLRKVLGILTYGNTAAVKCSSCKVGGGFGQFRRELRYVDPKVDQGFSGVEVRFFEDILGGG